MKLIEKLAKEYAAAGNHFYPDERDVANAFEAGYRYCRNSIIVEMEKSLSSRDVNLGNPIWRDFYQLGEEEE